MIHIRLIHLKVALGLATSALAYYFSTGLDGHWLPVWLAPIPVLVLAAQLSGRASFTLALVVYLLGGLNMVSYLAGLVPAPVLAAVWAAPALAFALAVTAQRWASLRWRHWAAAWVFPAAWTSYELLVTSFSPHGSFGSLAYTQAEVLPVIQATSLAGTGGISFLLTLVPAGLAAAWIRSEEGGRALVSALPGIVLLLGALFFGWARLAEAPAQPALRVGLAATDRTLRFFNTQRRDEALPVLRDYAHRIGSLAGQGAAVVVLPEKFVGIAPAYQKEAESILAEAARAHGVAVVAGLHLTGRTPARNVALVFGPDGRLHTTYDKAFPVPGWEAGYRAGAAPGLWTEANHVQAVAICKDMDFPAWLRRYSRGGAGIVFVPAWDFGRDARLHARMAGVRGVEGGFAVARSAREGLLTLSDPLGRIVREAPSSGEGGTWLVGDVPPGRGHTLYSRLGDWPGLASPLLLLVLLVAAGRRRPELRFDDLGRRGTGR